MKEDVVREITVQQLTLLRNDAEHKAVFVVGQDNLPAGIDGKKKRLVLNRIAASRNRARNKHCKPRVAPCLRCAECATPNTARG